MKKFLIKLNSDQLMIYQAQDRNFYSIFTQFFPKKSCVIYIKKLKIAMIQSHKFLKNQIHFVYYIEEFFLISTLSKNTF